MLIVDLLLIAILVLAVLGGATRGLVASIGALVGLVIGGIAAYWLSPLLGALVAEPVWRAVVIAGSAIGLLIIGTSLGSAVGMTLRRGVDRAAPLRVVDRILGGAVSLVIAALAVSLVGTTIATTGIPTVSSAVASSRVLQTIDDLIPSPVQAGIAQLRGAVVAGGIPSLGTLLQPQPVAPQRPVNLSDPDIQRASTSIARISGTAYACGESLTGTGFAVRSDEIVTNAHVVAGVDAPVVELPGRGALDGKVVYFDPENDIAVIRVPGMGATPLRVSSTLGAGSAAVVAGYPYGGPFTTVDAAVESVGSVRVPNIYSSREVLRDIYALQAVVRPGDSGGPLLTGSGTVAGITFARDEKNADRGYAMTSTMLTPVISKAASSTAPVSTGHCTTG
ncbi:colicin V production protein [Microbacterium mangrovi]|uniref:Colicin V production protein n=1 Tax=Microbacterium mangrovi TaxID=1348253 RepID=A0A0B2A5S7_9MICO|nr:MarP family serine protease [Microbacterium mangrovi]KHK98440.1 colicin V production protein [Microbacterium mangrovi]